MNEEMHPQTVSSSNGPLSHSERGGERERALWARDGERNVTERRNSVSKSGGRENKHAGRDAGWG